MACGPTSPSAKLAAGRLPNLARLTATGSVTRANSVFPSITSVAYLPFLTGRFPGSCNIPGIRWLDRTAYRGRWWRDRAAVRSYCGYQAGMLDSDIAEDAKTIFQLVPESMAVFTMISRGLSPDRDPAQGARKFIGSLAHYTEDYSPLDRRASRELLAAIDGPWRFVFVQYPGIDGYTHCDTPHGPRVLESLQHIDRTIGEAMTALEERGELDETLFVLVSDHGATVMHTHLDLAQWFIARGVPTMHHPVLWTRNPRVAVMVGGNAFASLYAQPDIPRASRLTLHQRVDPRPSAPARTWWRRCCGNRRWASSRPRKVRAACGSPRRRGSHRAA